MLSFSVICARQTLGVLKSILLVPEQSFFHCAICKTAFTLLTLAWIPPSCTVTRRPVQELGLWMPILQRGKPLGIPRSLHLWVVCSPSTIPCFSVIAHSVWCKEAFQKPGETGLVHLACSFQAFWIPSLLVELARGAQLLWGPCCFQSSWKEGLPRFPGVSCRAIHKDSNKPSVDNCMKGNYPILPRGPFVHAHIPPVLSAFVQRVKTSSKSDGVQLTQALGHAPQNVTSGCLLLNPKSLCFHFGNRPPPVFIFAFKAIVVPPLTARTSLCGTVSQEGRHYKVA